MGAAEEARPLRAALRERGGAGHLHRRRAHRDPDRAEPWIKDGQKEKWFKDWFEEFSGSEEDDLFAYAFQYAEGAPVKEDGEGTPYAIQPEQKRYRSIDCSGFIRTVFGYRGRFPLIADEKSGDGLPRTANGMARSKAGTDIIKLAAGSPPYERPKSISVLQPGDLVFFKLDARTKERLDGNGYYAKTMRSAKRL